MKTYRLPSAKAQGLVEFALILAAFIFMLMLIVDLGRVVFVYSSIQNAAREGARSGIIYPVRCDLAEAEALRLTAGLQANVNCFSPYDGALRVTVTYDFTPSTPVLMWLRKSSNTITLSSQATMLIEE
jgi:hypothetical protein